MRVYDLIVEQRYRTADLLGTLTRDQLGRPSLCGAWTVHDVAAHLLSFLRFGQLKLYLGILATGADFDRINVLLTRREAGRPSPEIIELLHRRAGSRVTIPRSGYDPVLTDLVLHDLDIRVPLGVPCATRESALWVAFQHLTQRPSPAFGLGDRLSGLRVEATDTGWAQGSGAPVYGRAEALLMAIAGRLVAFDELTGDGAATLLDRVKAPVPKPGPGRRLTVPLRVLLRPAPPARRSRTALADPP